MAAGPKSADRIARGRSASPPRGVEATSSRLDGTTSPGRSIDQATLEALYTRLEKPIYNVVYRWLWDPDEARDVVQDAFVKLWRARDRVEPATIEPYLYKIAINAAANRRRSKRLWSWISLSSATEPASRAPDPGEAAEQRERHALVRAAIDALPEKQRRVIVLCEFSRMSYDQVAQVLGVPPGTVASRRHAALATLRRRLTGAFADRAGDDR